MAGYEVLMEADHRRRIWFDQDPQTGLIEIRVEYNNDMHLAPTAERRKDAVKGFKDTKQNGGAHHYAHIPDALIPELHARGLVELGGAVIDLKGLLKWLGKSENEVFRIKSEKLA